MALATATVAAASIVACSASGDTEALSFLGTFSSVGFLGARELELAIEAEPAPLAAPSFASRRATGNLSGAPRVDLGCWFTAAEWS